MTEPGATKEPAAGGSASAHEAASNAVPWGYRPGVITAITVFLAFSLAFLRYWSFEAPGVWRWYSVFALCLLALSVLLQLVALFRALRLEDARPTEYRVTVRWFFAAVVVMVVGVLLAALETTLAAHP